MHKYPDTCPVLGVNVACMILPDVKPLSVVQRKKGFSDACKVSGPDIMHELMGRDYSKY